MQGRLYRPATTGLAAYYLQKKKEEEEARREAILAKIAAEKEAEERRERIAERIRQQEAIAAAKAAKNAPVVYASAATTQAKAQTQMQTKVVYMREKEDPTFESITGKPSMSMSDALKITRPQTKSTQTKTNKVIYNREKYDTTFERKTEKGSTWNAKQGVVQIPAAPKDKKGNIFTDAWNSVKNFTTDVVDSTKKFIADIGDTGYEGDRNHPKEVFTYSPGGYSPAVTGIARENSDISQKQEEGTFNYEFNKSVNTAINEGLEDYKKDYNNAQETAKKDYWAPDTDKVSRANTGIPREKTDISQKQVEGTSNYEINKFVNTKIDELLEKLDLKGGPTDFSKRVYWIIKLLPTIQLNEGSSKNILFTNGGPLYLFEVGREVGFKVETRNNPYVKIVNGNYTATFNEDYPLVPTVDFPSITFQAKNKLRWYDQGGFMGIGGYSLKLKTTFDQENVKMKTKISFNYSDLTVKCPGLSANVYDGYYIEYNSGLTTAFALVLVSALVIYYIPAAKSAVPKIAEKVIELLGTYKPGYGF